MGTFDRLKNVAKGKASKVVGDLERANPEAVYASECPSSLTDVAIGDHARSLLISTGSVLMNAALP